MPPRERDRLEGDRPGSPPDAPAEDASAEVEEEFELEVELEVTDVLDLHSFPPREVAELVRDYLDVAVERGWPQVRIVHGKGAGVQRERVRSILLADPRVEAFGDAPAEAGGWGATWARLRPPAADPSPTRRNEP
jgi:DNA-nicking Smr family endonuclease